VSDYDFRGLTTRLFEQMVQAVALQALGPGISVFGDGPDGGREATFEGQYPYPTALDSWDGYGVIQAKFRQRPLGAPEDGEWALEALRDELKTFSTAKDGRRRPEYYIFATNVVLTPPTGGGKDKAFALADELGEGWLRGFDVWDYDKLRSFLDVYGDIRRKYRAWVTPGDVLSAVLERFDGTPDFESILTNFLQKELLTDQYVNLEQAGQAGEERIPLAQVFVDVDVSEEPPSGLEDLDEDEFFTDTASEDNGFIRQIVDEAGYSLDPISLETLDEGDDPRLGRVVLVGGPGQGMTTVSQFICQIFRTALLHERPRALIDFDVSRAHAPPTRLQCRPRVASLSGSASVISPPNSPRRLRRAVSARLSSTSLSASSFVHRKPSQHRTSAPGSLSIHG